MGSCFSSEHVHIDRTLENTGFAITACRYVMRQWLCRDALHRLRYHAIQCHGKNIVQMLNEAECLMCDIESTPSVTLMNQLREREIRIEELEQRLERQEISRACCVCFQNTSCMLYEPCNHICVCERCDAQVLDRCPICRNDIDRRVSVYFS